jgi:carboxypeptidase C (cathepsin A)
LLALSPRNVVIHGNPVSLAATSEIFYNFRPADSDAEQKPLIVLFNGFASDVVRAFGTGPNTVQPDGTVVTNPDSLTRFANLLYIDPRQAGFSYDVISGRAATSDDCSQDVFSEYVDAADVLLATLQFLKAHSALQGPVYWMGESYAGVRIQWISGGTTISESASELTLGYPNGARPIAIFHYPSAGHMITMIEPHAFAADLSGWLAQHP